MKTIDVDLGNGTVAQITRPDRDDFPNNLGGAVQFALANVLTWLAETSGGAIGAFGGSALVSFLEHVEPGLVKYYSPLIDQLKGIEGIPPWFADFLDAIQNPEDEAGALVGQAVLGSAAGGITSSLLGVLLSPLTYGLNDFIRPARPVLPDLMTMEWRELLDPATLDDWASDQGWPAIAIEAYREALRPRPPIADLIAWAWRVHQDPEVVREELTKRGFEDEDTDRYMELAKRLPGAGDLVTFALREVWRDDIRPELLSPDAPELYYELMQKLGFERERAEDYWAAHWRLPSTGQGFEMFWRLPEFTEEHLRALLTRLDIMPAYHDQLIKIAYSPITRVDVRRMHATGQITDAELLTRYTDIGFSPADAAEMAEFTIRYNAETETSYTKTEILKGYKLGMIDAALAVALFEEMGRSREYAFYVLALEDYKRDLDILEQRIDIIEDRFVAHEIDTTTARGRLTQLNLTGVHIDRLLEEWGIRRRAKIALPTRANIEEFYKDGILDEPRARLELLKRRVPEYAIDWWILDWDQEIVDKARKEAERAQKEQERMAKAEFRTRRSVGLANLNRDIAELKLLLAEWKVVLFITDDEEMIDELKLNSVKAKAAIASLQLEKARLPVVPAEGG